METGSNNGRNQERAQKRDPQSQEIQGTEETRQSRSRSLERSRSELSPSTFSGNPFSGLMQLSREMDQWMESVFGRRFGFPSSGEPRSNNISSLWTPHIDVRQRGDSLVIHADLPGIPKDAVKIECASDGIAISGERQESREDRDREGGYSFAERRYGSFYRHIPLPDGAQTEQAKATMREGVLEITVPLRQDPKRRRIEIGS